jgi:diguanylate cyclase (GGDEF)-like protein
VAILDLVNFRNVNDSLGREAGDQLLVQVGRWLAAHLGDANLLARLDADHFGIVLPTGGGRGHIAHAIEPMMAAFMRASFTVGSTTLRVGARTGIAMYPADGCDAEALFKGAEAALKKAGTGGDRYLFFAEAMTHAVAGKLALESQLRSALENDQFVLHYQPKVGVASGRLVGAEALLRWNHPEKGLVAPGLFVPILEETGLISEVGRWALQQAVADWLRWLRTGLPAVRIAVNVSALQLRDPGFLTELAKVTAVSEHATDGLELEITESMVMADVRQCITTLQAIRAMGIRVAIDDFGTGFSSLGYLAKLPIDSLKVDRMFIGDMSATAEGLTLVSTMLTLAHALDLKVVAEGVETEEQARLLRLLKCDEIQGYLVSKPLPCAEFEARFLAEEWRLG